MEILNHFTGVTKTPSGWQAICPAHDDSTASLSISKGDDGRVLLYCHAKCSTESVVRAAGLEMRDLMPHVEAQNRHQQKQREPFKFECAYDYHDASGKLIFQACRGTRGGKKTFLQRQPDGNGDWIWKAPEQPVLYRLPRLVANVSGVVFALEGEKDVDAAESLGLIATTSPGGAGKWRARYAESLRNQRVVIIPDNDKPGEDHAQDVARSLLGVAASVKILRLPGLPPKGDLSDWLAAGGTAEKLHELATECAEYVPELLESNTPEVTDSVSSLNLKDASARTDVANAKRFHAMFGSDVRWCEPWGKWLVWDGCRWSSDAEKRIDTMAKRVADQVWKETAKLLPKADFATGKELTAFARSTASARGISNMLALAKSEPGVPILPDVLNAEPWLLNCPNGTIDLRTGKLRPHAQSDYLTTLCPTPYDPAATCERWQRAVDTILDGKRDLIGFVQRLLGSAIVGTVVEHILPILWGDGSNGKGLFLETIMDDLGPDYACKISSEVLMASKGDRHPTELADLHGKRLVVASETDDGRRLREGLLKEITGGDTIKARRMREDFWQFRPSHTLVLLTNHKPIVKGNDHGVWRRLCLVPFTQKFWDADRGQSGPPELKADKYLRDALEAEHAGILAWLVRGCLEWQCDGLRQPEEVTAATAEYRSEMDVIGAFLGECCIEEVGCTAKASDVYASYVAWCKASGEHPITQRRFGIALSDRGLDRYKSDGVWYRGLMLTEPSEPSEQCF